MTGTMVQRSPQSHRHLTPGAPRDAPQRLAHGIDSTSRALGGEDRASRTLRKARSDRPARRLVLRSKEHTSVPAS